MILESVQVGHPRVMGSGSGPDPWDRRWRSAFAKTAVSGPVRAGRTNLAGDRQADRRVHGGPEQAVLCYSAGHYPAWREELGLPEMGPGGFGENLTISGVAEASVCIGDVLEIGDAVLQVTSPRGPCYKIGYRWRRADLLARVETTRRHGWYCRVLQEGELEAGQRVRLLERPQPDWPVLRAGLVIRERKLHPQLLAELARMPEFHAQDRVKFARSLGSAARPRLRAGP